MPETCRLAEAAFALSQLLQANSIPHAFHGNILTAILSDSPRCHEIYCIVEGNPTKPFRRVRQAIASSEHFTIVCSTWSSQLHASYRKMSPPIEIEVLPAGEHGPRRLDRSTTMSLKGIPFLSFSEFIRDKLKAWIMRRSECDAQDIVYTLCRYWNRLDINRVPEHDMNHFVASHRMAALPWGALKKKYGM